MENNMCNVEKRRYVWFTVIFNLLFLYFKFLTFGWVTIIILWFFPLYLILYNIASVLTAKIKNKTKGDYIRFWCLGCLLLFSGLTFCDFGDYGPPAQIIRFLPYKLSLIICFSSFCLCIILSIVSILIYILKKKKLSKV